jgi:hypothetical protein
VVRAGGELALAIGLHFWYTKCMKRSRHSVHQKPKKKMGRPATGRDPAVTVRIPPDMLDEIERWAKANGCSRSAAVVAMIGRGLKQAGE